MYRDKTRARKRNQRVAFDARGVRKRRLGGGGGVENEKISWAKCKISSMLKDSCSVLQA